MELETTWTETEGESLVEEASLAMSSNVFLIVHRLTQDHSKICGF